MAFVNEYITEADYEKYDLKQVCSEHNRSLHRDRFIYVNAWTIDRERDTFMTKIWTHREAEFEGYAFYWKGEWMFFDMRTAGHKYDQARNAIWFRLLVKGFAVPDRLITQHEALMDHLREAITANDAVTGTISNRSATIEFITE